MKNHVIALLLLVCLEAVYATDLPEFPFVYSEGRATTNVPPNKVVIDLTIKCFDSASSNAVETVEKTSAQVVQKLQESFGIDLANVSAKNLIKNAVQKRTEHEYLEILGYDVSREITISSDRMELFPQLMEMLSSIDFTTHINAEFERTDKDQILSDLTAQACADAHRKSGALATASGGKLGALFAISSEGLGEEFFAAKFRPYFRNQVGEVNYFGVSKESEMAFFAPDTIEYNAGVTTIYKLE